MNFEINGETITIHPLWLRDNCRCEQCFNSVTNQKKSTDINVNVEIKQYTVVQDDIKILWNDDHNSIYNLNWIKSQHRPEMRPRIITWDGNEVEQKLLLVESEENNLTEDGVKQLLKSLLQFGVAIVKNVTPTIDATRKVVTSIGPIMHTLYGEMWEINQRQFGTYQDTAYTNETLMIHTDNTYCTESAGVEIFHCTKQANGGETVLADGFRAAEILKEQHKEYFDCLKLVPIEWQYISEDYYYTFVSPVLNTFKYSDELEQIRFNIYDRSARNLLTPPSQLDTFYRSLKTYRDILNDPKLKWQFSLAPGTVIFINNWRVLHGRQKFTGARKLLGCYQAMNTILSKARKLKLIL